MDITDELVAHIAGLARLSLSDEDAAGMKEHFRKVLDLVEELQQLDTAAVDPALFSLDVANVMREDEVRASLPLSEVLRVAPAAEPPYFLVPRIVADAAEDPSGG